MKTQSHSEQMLDSQHKSSLAPHTWVQESAVNLTQFKLMHQLNCKLQQAGGHLRIIKTWNPKSSNGFAVQARIRGAQSPSPMAVGPTSVLTCFRGVT